MAGTPTTIAPTTIATDIAFAEAPRWHQGTLWWSDMHGGGVRKLVAGHTQTVCEIPTRPSGLGWLPDGQLLVVSMTDKRILRLQPDGTLVTHADAAHLVPCRLNDMIVDRHGRAYVGNFGFELDEGAQPRPTVLVRVDLDGTARIVADDLMFPNGMVITAAGHTLVVAETFGARLTAFDIDAAGALTNRRTWAPMPDGAVADGICLDSEGAIWVASPTTHECLRLGEGGAVLDRIPTGRGAYACVLGGAEGKTLFVCTADSHKPERQRTERNGRIEAFAVAVPG